MTIHPVATHAGRLIERPLLTNEAAGVPHWIFVGDQSFTFFALPS
jgi:hypothetical protein